MPPSWNADDDNAETVIDLTAPAPSSSQRSYVVVDAAESPQPYHYSHTHLGTVSVNEGIAVVDHHPDARQGFGTSDTSSSLTTSQILGGEGNDNAGGSMTTASWIVQASEAILLNLLPSFHMPKAKQTSYHSCDDESAANTGLFPAKNGPRRIACVWRRVFETDLNACAARFARARVAAFKALQTLIENSDDVRAVDLAAERRLVIQQAVQWGERLDRLAVSCVQAIEDAIVLAKSTRTMRDSGSKSLTSLRTRLTSLTSPITTSALAHGIRSILDEEYDVACAKLQAEVERCIGQVRALAQVIREHRMASEDEECGPTSSSVAFTPRVRVLRHALASEYELSAVCKLLRAFLKPGVSELIAPQ